jgi:sugar O-acyltransferase (sialic acid O-acetyltransferase NeuD family)
MSSLIIVGAGGFGLEVAAYAKDCLKAGLLPHEPRGFLDDTRAKGSVHAELPVLGNTEGSIDVEAVYLIALGNPESRYKIAAKLTQNGARFATLLHPASYIASTAIIGQGSIAAPFSFIGPQSQTGNHVLVNIYASVAHESSLGHFSTLCPYAGTHASAKIGEGVFFGAHSIVTNNVSIGSWSKLAAGSVVYSDVPVKASVMGNPARFKVND